MATENGLWPHQQRVFDLLMSGKNVILQAPTGSGKTRAALYPFLYALDPQGEYSDSLPGKCIYSVPMRVLAKQFFSEYDKLVGRYNLRYGLNISRAIQMGEEQGDRVLASNLIFATIDQTLSSFLVSPYSLPRRKANINAGAVMAAYLVFDEFHLFDPASTLPTTLHMLRMLRGITPFVLMTATFSRKMLDELAELLDAEIVGRDPEALALFRELPSQQKIRRYHAAGQLSAKAVWDRHTGRSLVICNTVDRARFLYERLTEQVSHETEVLLLHSRFLPEDRNKTEDVIRARFGKDDHSGGSLIVVATQAIEVGLDITSTALHTELAPANAIIQRAGRCARYEGNEGDVYVYRDSTDASGETVNLCEKENVNPYQGQAALFQETYQQIEQYSGQVLDFEREQSILSTVHSEQDRQIVESLRATSFDHQRRMYAVMRGDDDADARHLIREVFQQQVTIHANPDELLAAPFDAPSFGLHPGTVQRYLKGKKDKTTEEHVGGWLQRPDVEWAVKYLYEYPDFDQSNESRYEWRAVPTLETARGARLLVVNPQLATYHPKLGFLADRGGDWQAELPPKKEHSGDRRYAYRLETYAEHIRRVYEAYQELWPELAGAARRLEQCFNWPQGSVQDTAELTVLLHDVGKLSDGWQGWVRRYQQSIGEPVQAEQAYAHTHWSSDNLSHQEAQRKAGKRPWHAVEGALATLHTLAGCLHNALLATAAFSAIARHHAPYSGENQKFRLRNDAVQHVSATLGAWGNVVGEIILIRSDQELEPGYQPEDDIADLNQQPTKDDVATYLTYLLLVRVLRRADQLGTERGAKGL